MAGAHDHDDWHVNPELPVWVGPRAGNEHSRSLKFYNHREKGLARAFSWLKGKGGLVSSDNTDAS